MKNKQAGAAGGILALMVFSLGSYPLQLPEFWVVLVVLIGVIESSSVAIDTPPTLSPAGRKILSVTVIGGWRYVADGFWGSRKAITRGIRNGIH